MSSSANSIRSGWSERVANTEVSEVPDTSLIDLKTTSQLMQLADIIKETASSLNTYLAKNALPQPSLEVDGVPLQIPPSEREILQAKSTLLSATRQLRSLVKGPIGIIMDIGANEILCLQVIQRYRIAEAFGIEEQIDFQTLSTRCGLNVKDLQRILRYAMTSDIFTEPSPGIVAHTAVSRVLAELPLMRDFVENVCEIRFPASASAADALKKYGLSTDSNQSGFSMSRNTARGVYDELLHYPEENRRWNGAMSALAQEIDYDFILKSFDWNRGPLSVVDVGGGRGDVSIGLAQALPHAKFIVQDMSATALDSGSKQCAADKLLKDQISYQPYDFRDPQTTQGDVYYFRNIFHNWPDEMCLQILRNQIPALQPGNHLVIDDFTLHKPGTLPWTEERRRRWMDINMLVFFGSRERTLDEWRSLLHTADPRFHLVDVNISPYYPSAILDVVWDKET